MMPTTERAEAISRARRAVKLLNEHEAPTRRDLGEARERFNDCYNLPAGEQVWDAVDRLEDTAARTYGVPAIDQARTEGVPASAGRPGKRPEDRTVSAAEEAPQRQQL